MSWTPEHFNPIAEQCGTADKCRYYISWIFSNECHAGCPYCMVGTSSTKYVPRKWSDQQAIFAWQQFHDDHGPASILFGGYEPGERLPLMSHVLTHHYGMMVTNFTFDEKILFRLIPADRLILHPSFHARLWGHDIRPFLQKIAKVRAQGFSVPVVSIACWPPDFKHIEGWRDAVLAEGVHTNIHPLYGTSYQGRKLPDEYTDQEREDMHRFVNPFIYEDRVDCKPLEITACAAGHAAGGITMDGHFARCVQITEPMCDFMGGEHVKFWDEPRPCPAARCMCGNMGCFHVTQEVEQDGDRDADHHVQRVPVD